MVERMKTSGLILTQSAANRTVMMQTFCTNISQIIILFHVVILYNNVCYDV